MEIQNKHKIREDNEKQSLIIIKRKATHKKPNINDLFIKNSSNINQYIKRCHKLVKEG